MWIDRTNKTPLQSPLSYPTLPLLPIRVLDPGMASSSCYCREAVNSHVNKLPQLMEHRPVITDQRPAATARPRHRRAIPGVEDGPGDGVRTAHTTGPTPSTRRRGTWWSHQRRGRDRSGKSRHGIREARGRCRSYYDDAPHSAHAGADQQHDDRGLEKTAGAAVAVGVDDSEDRVHDAFLLNSFFVEMKETQP